MIRGKRYLCWRFFCTNGMFYKVPECLKLLREVSAERSLCQTSLSLSLTRSWTREAILPKLLESLLSPLKEKWRWTETRFQSNIILFRLAVLLRLQSLVQCKWMDYIISWCKFRFRSESFCSFRSCKMHFFQNMNLNVLKWAKFNASVGVTDNYHLIYFPH